MKTLQTIVLYARPIEVVEATEDECPDLVGRQGVYLDTEARVYVKAAPADVQQETVIHELVHCALTRSGVGSVLFALLGVKDDSKAAYRADEAATQLITSIIVCTLRPAGLLVDP